MWLLAIVCANFLREDDSPIMDLIPKALKQRGVQKCPPADATENKHAREYSQKDEI